MAIALWLSPLSRLGNCWHSGIFCAWDASVTKHLKSKAHALSKMSYRYLIQNSHKHLIHILTFQTSLPQSNIRSVSSNGCCSPICIVLFYIGLHQLEKAINLHSIHLYVMDAFGLIATFQDFSCQHKLRLKFPLLQDIMDPKSPEWICWNKQYIFYLAPPPNCVTKLCDGNRFQKWGKTT